jgi:hypothetical protein
LEDAFEDDELEDAADEIVAQTLLGIGIDLSAAMQDAPRRAPAVNQGSEQAADEAPVAVADEDARLVAELEARFGALAS